MATLTLIPLIHTHNPPTKLRFLGCITSYSPHTATLTLQHPPSPRTVDVDIALVVRGLPFGSLRDGMWVNVIGSVKENQGPGAVRVDALMLWEARGVDLGRYEKIVRERIKDGGVAEGGERVAKEN